MNPPLDNTSMKPEGNPLLHSNYYRIFQLIDRLDRSKGDQDAINEVVSLIRRETFNIKGYYIDITQAMNCNNNAQFEVELRVQCEERVFNVIFKKVSVDVVKELQKLTLNCVLYFSNVQAYLVLNQHKGGMDYILKFVFYKKSKMAQGKALENINKVGDNNKEYNIIQLNDDTIIEEPSLQLNRTTLKSLYRETINNCENHLHSSISNAFPEGNEIESNAPIEISNPQLDKELQEISDAVKDFSHLLIHPMSSSIYSVNNFPDILRALNYSQLATVCGIVCEVKFDNNVTTIILLSLKDSNTIKVIHFPNNWPFHPEEMQVLLLKNGLLKINKNLEIVQEIPLKSCVTCLGKLSPEEYDLFKKLRTKPEMSFSSIITLSTNTLNRALNKYCIIIKFISKISARIEKDYPSNSFADFPNLELNLRCMIDDGSYEAELYLRNKDVVTLLKLTSIEMKQIYSLAQSCHNCLLFQRGCSCPVSYISNESIESVTKRQYILYCVPYSNIPSKYYKNSGFQDYLRNLNQKNHIEKNLILRSSFINGDLYYNANSTSKIKLINKPILKAIQIEEVGNTDL